MDIDRQRIAAVRKLKELGFSYVGGQWVPTVAVGAPPPQIPTIAEADAMHAFLMRRADALVGCPTGSAGASELETIASLLEAYEAKRWPDGKEPEGKG